MRRRSIRAGWLAAAVVLALGCAGPPAPTESDSPAEAGASATATAVGSVADVAAAEAALRNAGRIGLVYTRSCQAAARPARRELAATGDCFDNMTVVVDLGTSTIVSITPNSGPSGG